MKSAAPKTIEDIAKDHWYYTVELAPDLMTEGSKFKNLAVTRRLLEAASVAGCRTLDIGTMEGVISTLLARRGSKVLATDSIDLGAKVRTVQNSYGVDFEYVPNIPVDRYVDTVLGYQSSARIAAGPTPLSYDTASPFGFDFIVSSGILHHVNNPVDHIATCRKLLKRDGYLLLETPAILSDEISTTHDFVGDGHVWGGAATWYVSTKFVETYLKANYLEPVLFSYIHSGGNIDAPMCRIAVLAKAVDKPAFSEEEKSLLRKSELYISYDFKPLHYYARLCGVSTCAPTVGEVLPQGVNSASKLNKHDILDKSPVDFDEQYLTLCLNDK